jgi:hypothetical protein
MNSIIELKKKLENFNAASEKRAAERKAAKAARGLLFKREYYPTYVSREAKWRVNILRKTKYLNKTQKDIILPKTKKLAIKLAYINLVESRIFYFWRIIQGIVMLIFTFGIGIYSSRSISANPWNSWGANPFYHIPLNGLLIGTLSLWVYIILMGFARRKSRNRLDLNLPSIDFLLSFVGLTILIGFSNRIDINTFTFALYTLLFGIAGRWLLFYLFGAIDTFLIFLVEAFGSNKLPESIVLNNVLRILNEIEGYPELISDLKFKKTAIIWLDYVAQAVSRDIPRLLKTIDGEFNISIRVNCQHIANSIKDKKLWVLTPKDDTAQYLAKYLSNFLFHFIKGDWDTLERLEAPKLTLYEKWTKRYLPVLRPVILIGIPIIAYWTLKAYNLTSEPWAGTVISYIILWIIINIIWLIDPTAKEKVGSFKDAAGLF